MEFIFECHKHFHEMFGNVMKTIKHKGEKQWRCKKHNQTRSLFLQDVLKFTCIFFLFTLAFFVGFHNLYWYFNDETLSYTQNGQLGGFVDAPAVQAFGE